MHTDPLAYFITWTCYGTWLPGDQRGWKKWQKGQLIPQPLLSDWCMEQMSERPLVLNEDQREIVEDTISRHCVHQNWKLHAVNCRSNHCHVVVTAKSHEGEQVRDQFKSWCTRKLKEAAKSACIHSPPHEIDDNRTRENWWTRKGSIRYVFDSESLEMAIRYTLEAQDTGGSQFEGQETSNKPPLK